MPEKSTYYRGYSTVGGKKLTRLYDFELVRQDLFNAFNTRKNSRPRSANYGSILPEMLFELRTDMNVSVIYDEVVRILNSDPRVSVLDIRIDTLQEYVVLVECDLLYYGDETQYDFNMKFDLENGIIENS